MSIEWKSVKKDGHPKEDGKYLVTLVGFLGIYNYIDTMGYTNDLYQFNRCDFYEYEDEIKKGFYSYDSKYGYLEVEDVIAWAKVEPYEGE